MNVSYVISQVNWFSVVVAALSAFVLGGFWYSPVLFGKKWAKELGNSDKEITKTDMIMIFVTTFILELIAAFVFDIFLGPDASVLKGLIFGFIISLSWIATSLGVTYLFSRKSFSLYLIDAGYYVVFFPVMGIILAAW